MSYYVEEYKKLLIEKNRIKKEIEALRQKVANEMCPFALGQKVEICSYSHTGKLGVITKIMGYFDVETIRWDEDNIIDLKENEYIVSFSWKVCGNVLKKDGTVGNLSFDFTQSLFDNYWNKKQKKEDK
jgi:hypothetical protein